MEAVNHWVKYGVRSPKFIWVYVHSCTVELAETPQPHSPAFGLIYEGDIG
jgi:hypothetical protein